MPVSPVCVCVCAWVHSILGIMYLPSKSYLCKRLLLYIHKLYRHASGTCMMCVICISPDHTCALQIHYCDVCDFHRSPTCKLLNNRKTYNQCKASCQSKILYAQPYGAKLCGIVHQSYRALDGSNGPQSHDLRFTNRCKHFFPHGSCRVS